MEQCYEIFLGTDAVGKVQVLCQGLYYRFICRCRLSGAVVYRLTVRCADKTENLGILVGMGDGYGLDKKIPVAHLGEGKMEFLLLPKSDRLEGKFIPICPEEPFSYIARLKDSFLVRQGGQAGILIKSKQGTV